MPLLALHPPRVVTISCGPLILCSPLFPAVSDFPFLPRCLALCSLFFSGSSLTSTSLRASPRPCHASPSPLPWPLFCPHSSFPSMTSSPPPPRPPPPPPRPPFCPHLPAPLCSPQLRGQDWRAQHVCLIVLLWLLDAAHLDSGAQMCGCHSDLGPSGKYGRPPAPEQRTK